MNVLPVSVYMITQNEQSNLASVLKVLQCVEEIVIVDSGSTDQTEAIARSFPNVKFFFNEWPGFGKQKQFALSLCQQPWALNLDADEIPTDQLLSEIENHIAADQYDALECTRILLRQGVRPRSFDKRDRLIRFFRREKGHYPSRRVHESIWIEGSVAQTQATILHFENLTFSQRIAKSNHYSELSAQDKFDKNQRVSLLVVGIIFPITFLKYYLIKGHILDGANGFLTSMNTAFYAFMKYAKLWEMHDATDATEPVKPKLVQTLPKESTSKAA